MNVTVPCLCPPNAVGEARHPDGDTITLRDRLDFRSAATVRNRLAVATEERLIEGEILAVLVETYVLLGITAWSVVDEKGKPVPPSRENITDRLLVDFDAATMVGNAADELYTAAVILPVLARASTSSPPMPIAASTSAPSEATPTPPKRSKRSSTTTIPTAVTATTSPLRAGASS
jgi:hypothetical protein